MPSFSWLGYFSQLLLKWANTFIYIWGKTTHKDLAWVTLHSFSILMRKAVGRAQARQALLRPLLVWKAILHWEQGRVTWGTTTLRDQYLSDYSHWDLHKAKHQRRTHKRQTIYFQAHELLRVQAISVNFKYILSMFFFNSIYTSHEKVFGSPEILISPNIRNFLPWYSCVVLYTMLGLKYNCCFHDRMQAPNDTSAQMYSCRTASVPGIWSK